MGKLDPLLHKNLAAEVHRDHGIPYPDAANSCTNILVKLLVERRSFGTISRNAQKIIVGHSRSALQAVPEAVKTVRGSVVASRMRVETEKLDHQGPPCIVPVCAEPHVRQIHVAVVEHREAELPCALVQLGEYVLAREVRSRHPHYSK